MEIAMIDNLHTTEEEQRLFEKLSKFDPNLIRYLSYLAGDHADARAREREREKQNGTQLGLSSLAFSGLSAQAPFISQRLAPAPYLWRAVRDTPADVTGPPNGGAG